MLHTIDMKPINTLVRPKVLRYDMPLMFRRCNIKLGLVSGAATKTVKQLFFTAVSDLTPSQVALSQLCAEACVDQILFPSSKMRLSRAEYKEIVRWTEKLRPTRRCMKILKDKFPRWVCTHWIAFSVCFRCICQLTVTVLQVHINVWHRK